MTQENPIILCLASEFKGERFIETCKALGCKVILITREKFGGHPWPHEALDEFHTMESLIHQPNITYAVGYLARTHAFDRIVALDDYDVETVAALREHLRLPGMGDSPTRFFRDKLAMRIQARTHAIPVPEFTPVFHYPTLEEFLGRVPPPWVLKPRFEAGSHGIKKISRAEEVWGLLHKLGDEQSFFHLEQFVPGKIEVFHVDSVVWEGKILFSTVSAYGQPPLSVAQGGGIFTTRTLPRTDPDAKALIKLNKQVLRATGMTSGINHAEFIEAHDEGGRFYFLEVAARVGGAHIAEMIEFATGINLWAEWAKIEVALARGKTYTLPEVKDTHGGTIICLAKQEWPDTSAFDDPEVVWRVPKQYHAGLILNSPDPRRIQALLEAYAPRFAQEYLTSMPLPEKSRV